MNYACCALLALPLLMAGCGRPVQIVDQAAFTEMARRMPEEMQARSIVDRSNSYREALFGPADEAYGRILFGRLSPDFLPEKAAMFRARTFRELAAGSRARTSISRSSFTLETVSQKIMVRMIGILDWEGAGRNSWLVSCLFQPRVGRSLEQYLLIPTPVAERGVLQARPAAMYECFGSACTMYVRDSAVPAAPAPAADPLSERTTVRESLPGLNQITTPPQEQRPDSSLRERSL
ncbi:MAG: hypothetical protein ACI33N_03160 [Desulfovibrionaceae bacterium]